MSFQPLLHLLGLASAYPKQRLRLLCRLFSVVTAIFLSGCGITATKPSSIPSPLQMRADVQVSGRVSTLNHIDIQHLGKRIPATFSDGKIHNSRGYDWWISKHFALKSDLPERKVRLYLELLEMSYPHYVELFGKAPAGIDKKRIAVVYGSSRERTREAMLDDGFTRGVHQHAGGETMFYNRAGYNFPSHRHHHQRYIVIHETMHAFHMALSGHSTWAPNWITEGMADAIASHVYYPNTNQLAVMVFDRAPMNYLLSGLYQYHQAGQPTFEEINDDPALKRGLNFLIIHFLLTDPQRYHYFKRFISELMVANPHSEATLPTANALLKSTFPNWQQLEIDFADFVNTAKPSFYIVNGPWEQSGNAYWLRNSSSNKLQRLDIEPSFGEVNHAVMDFPAPPYNKLIINQDKQGIAALIQFQSEQLHRGDIGMALQLQQHSTSDEVKLGKLEAQAADFSQDNLLQFVIVDGVKLEVSSNLNLFPTQVMALQPELLKEIKQTLQLGINLHQSNEGLAITLTSEHHQQQARFDHPTLALDELNLSQISLLGRNNNHSITPYFAAHRSSAAKTHTANPWLFAHAPLLNQLFSTCVSFASELPQCQSQLSDWFNKLSYNRINNNDVNSMTTTLKRWRTHLGDKALLALSGIDVRTYFHQGRHYLYLNNPSRHTATVTLSSVSEALQLASGEHRIELPDAAAHNLAISWLGLNHRTELDTQAPPFDGVNMAINIGETITFELSGPYSGDSSGHVTVNFIAYQDFSNKQPLWQKAVSFSPYQQLKFAVAAPAKAKSGLIEVIAEVNVDGEPIRLVERRNW
ncbi:hypothetical protein [Pseudoalteromonas 'SMAR']|uniref:hypothetical protein n=1 Tax=Pseudoalteromonas 'SMAR' TaxID=3416908 RepID=UPI003AF2C458